MDQTSPNFLAFLPLLLTIFVIVFAIFGLLMPFFVFRIRNEIIKVNKNITKVIQVLSENSRQQELL